VGENIQLEDMGDESETKTASAQAVYVCDRCGFEMIQRNCKVICPNCGNRFDCSDLSLYFD
jgi:rubrerythrin